MITDGLWAVLFAAVSWIVGLLPAGGSIGLSALAGGAGYLSFMGVWVDLQMFTIVAGAIVSLETAMIVFRVVRFVLKLWPG